MDETRTTILPELVELANDEQSHVRLAGLDAVVSILSLLDDGQNGHILCPLPSLVVILHNVIAPFTPHIG